MKFTKALLAILAASTATGCVNQRAASDIRTTSTETSNLMNEARAPLEIEQKNAVNRHSDVYVGTRSVVNENGDPLPQRVEKTNGITIKNGSLPVSLKEVAVIISEHAKIPVVVAASVPVATPSQPQNQQAAPVEFAAGPIPNGFPLEEALQELNNANVPTTINAGPSPVNEGSMVLNFSGRLSDLLDLVSSNFNVTWKYERGKIVIDSTITRNFDVPALPMVTNLAFGLGVQEGSAGAQAKTDLTVDVFQELTDALGKLVGDNFSINRSTGVVTVTGSPAVVSRARDYINNLNDRLKDQVALSVKVYSVTVRDNEDFALNLAGVFKSSKELVNLAGAGTAGAMTGGGSLGWALIDEKSQYNGSEAAVKALSQRGDVSVVTTASLTTVNGQPVPLQVGQDRDYVKEIAVETDENGAETVTFETAEVSTGFALQMMPRIQRNGDVLLQYGINIKELVGADDGFEERKIGDNTVQLKRLNQRNFIQNANIPHGKTLVLAGFEQVRSSTNNSGTGHPLFPLLGGSSSASKERDVIVIMITPTVLK